MARAQFLAIQVPTLDLIKMGASAANVPITTGAIAQATRRARWSPSVLTSEVWFLACVFFLACPQGSCCVAAPQRCEVHPAVPTFPFIFVPSLSWPNQSFPSENALTGWRHAARFVFAGGFSPDGRLSSGPAASPAPSGRHEHHLW